MMQDRLHTLIDEHFSGVMDAEARQELDSLLVNSPEARSEFLRAAQLHVQLFLTLNRDTVIPHDDVTDDLAVLPAHGRARPTPTASRKSRLQTLAQEFAWQPLSLVLMAVALISGGLLAWQLSHTPSQPIAGNITVSPDDVSVNVARLSRTSGAIWKVTDNKSLPVVGTELATGHRLHVDNGVVEIVYATGATIVVQGPAEFVVGANESPFPIPHSNAGFLFAGKLVAIVPPQAKGFTILTPTARIIDLGTEFGIWVRPDDGDRSATDVQVFKGRVVLERSVPGGGNQGALARLELKTGEAATSREGEELLAIQPDANFVRSLPAATPAVAAMDWPRDSSLQSGDIVVATCDDLKLVKINPQTGAQSLLATGKRKLHGDWTTMSIGRGRNVLVGANGLPGVGLGVLRMDPQDDATALLGRGATVTDPATAISQLVEDADRNVYALYSNQGKPAQAEIVMMDSVTAKTTTIAALDDASAIHIDHNGRDLIVVGSRTGLVGLLHDGKLTPWIVDSKRLGTPASVVVGREGRVFVATTLNSARTILEISRNAPYTVTKLATLPPTERSGSRWNIALEPDGNLIAGPNGPNGDLYRINTAIGQTAIVSAGGLLGGEAIVTVVP